MKISEEWIIAQAPNPAAVQNGRKLSQKGSFSQLSKTEDETLFWADCAGSGKTPYHTSIDFSNTDAPTCRCSCPSHQFPCKHAVGLMFEIMENKDFCVAQIPQELLEKREKQAARAAQKVQTSMESAAAPRKTNNAAKAKKIQKQLEGIEQAERMLSDLMLHGLGTLTGVSIKNYEKLAKDLGSYYLTGAQEAFFCLAYEIEEIQKNPNQTDYSAAVRTLIRLNALLQKSRVFLKKKLDDHSYDAQDNLLYEALGGVWKLSELEKLGSYQEDAQLVQLSFDVLYDEAKKQYIDRGYWMELQSGKLCQTRNYRPVKALKHIKAEDTCFDMVKTPRLFFYPGSVTQRVRWNSFELQPVCDKQLKRLIELAQHDLTMAVKETKNEIKNTMSEKYMAVLLSFQTIGKIGEEFVLKMHDGQCIALRDRRDDGESHASVAKLVHLPNSTWRENQVIFGLMFYDDQDARLCIHPYSVITTDQIIRLQY